MGGAPRTRESFDDWEDQWHVDSFKSFIHLSVTLQGSRKLWMKASKTKACNADEKEVCHVMSAGSFYFTAPTAVKHNIEWAESDWKSRSICVQFRTQVPCQRFRPNDLRLQLARGVSSVLSTRRLVMLSLADVLKIEKAPKETLLGDTPAAGIRTGFTKKLRRQKGTSRESENKASRLSGMKQKIHIQKDNPKVVGSAAHARYEAYKRARSVASFFRMG